MPLRSHLQGARSKIVQRPSLLLVLHPYSGLKTWPPLQWEGGKHTEHPYYPSLDATALWFFSHTLGQLLSNFGEHRLTWKLAQIQTPRPLPPVQGATQEAVVLASARWFWGRWSLYHTLTDSKVGSPLLPTAPTPQLGILHRKSQILASHNPQRHTLLATLIHLPWSWVNQMSQSSGFNSFLSFLNFLLMKNGKHTQRKTVTTLQPSSNSNHQHPWPILPHHTSTYSFHPHTQCIILYVSNYIIFEANLRHYIISSVSISFVFL